ncbi:MAG: hypothetical protein Q4F17_04960 [Eubacteriales bacterium]|nr:hypothetical protein [Eubacteriales bacterium]
MATACFLAMTAAEISGAAALPPRAAWMSCRFSLYSRGLSGLPQALPPGSVVVLDDQNPFFDHDPDRIAGELAACVRDTGAWGVLLDFQRPGVDEVQALAEQLCSDLPCPVAVTAAYAKGLRCPVFLPPLPCHVPLADWLAPWAGRETWLELALDAQTVTLTDKGASFVPGEPGDGGFRDERLHCHYTVAVEEDRAVFSLWRTAEDLTGLLKDADRLGVKAAVGLYQELGLFAQSL